jgi:hypothetical protein
VIAMKLYLPKPTTRTGDTPETHCAAAHGR